MPDTFFRPPISGYNVWWSLAGIRIDHQELTDLLDEAGFAGFAPSPPSPKVALRRALKAWARTSEGHEDEDEEASEGSHSKLRITSVSAPRSRYVAYLVVGERHLHNELGIDFSVGVRILLHKDTEAMIVTTESGFNEALERRLASTDIGLATAHGTDAEAALAAQIGPYWAEHRTLLRSTDLSRMVTEIVAGTTIYRTPRRAVDRARKKDPHLGGLPLKESGGLYFVSVTEEERLFTLKRLIEGLPTFVRKPHFTTARVYDEEATREEMAQAVIASIEGKVAELRGDLAAISEGKQRTQTVRDRLTSYSQLRQQIQLYESFLGGQVRRLNGAITDLEGAARELLVG